LELFSLVVTAEALYEQFFLEIAVFEEGHFYSKF